MKNVIKNYRTLSIALIAAFALSFSTVTKANDEIKNKSVAAIELKFIGELENKPVLELNLTNVEEDQFTITFFDHYGNVIYSNKVKGTNITKKYLINSEEIGDDVLRLEVKAKNGHNTEVYTIQRSQTSVNATVVTKIK